MKKKCRFGLIVDSPKRSAMKAKTGMVLLALERSGSSLVKPTT